MRTCNRRNGIVVAVAAALATLASATALAAANSGTSDDAAATAVQTQDTGRALVILNGDPLSTYVKTKPQQGKKIDFASNTTKSYRAQLSALRNQYKQWLQATYPQAKITGNFDISLNAVAVQLNGAPLAGIAASPLSRPRTKSVPCSPRFGRRIAAAPDSRIALFTAAGVMNAAEPCGGRG